MEAETNRYYKGTGQITIEMERVIVGDRLSQFAVSKLGTKIVKLYLGDTETHDCFKNWQELTYEEVQKELLKDEWITATKP